EQAVAPDGAGRHCSPESKVTQARPAGELLRSAQEGPVFMTEAEWLSSDDQDEMLSFLHREASPRKLRLLCCACCRRVWHFLKDERLRELVESAERYADGLESLEELKARWSVGWEIWGELARQCPDNDRLSAESEAAGAATRVVEGPDPNLASIS